MCRLAGLDADETFAFASGEETSAPSRTARGSVDEHWEQVRSEIEELRAEVAKLRDELEQVKSMLA